jgi:hypothetical protein
MDKLQRLNDVNDVPIYSVKKQEFRSYGHVLKGYDLSELIDYVDLNTSIPDKGNCYIASVNEMETMSAFQQLTDKVFGGMPIQIGYCNGKNNTYNGFEYHKGSEIYVAVTDCMMALGHSYDIVENSYANSQATVFFIKKGTIIELFQTTLHLSPIRVCNEGFKTVVVLPRGTNTPFSVEEKIAESTEDPEQKLLLYRNKWMIAHPERVQLINQGAYPGIIGENKELYY